MAVSEYERELGGIQQSIRGLEQRFDAMERTTSDHRRDMRERHKSFYELIGRQSDEIEAIAKTLGELAGAVKAEAELSKTRLEAEARHTDTRFRAIWRWLAPLGGIGAAAGGGSLLWRMLQGGG